MNSTRNSDLIASLNFGPLLAFTTAEDKKMTNTIAKRIALAVAAVTLVGSTASAAMLPRQGDRAATINFSFVVGKQVMAPGEYIVRTEGNGMIRVCEDGVYCASVTMHDATPGADDAVLIFAESGDAKRLLSLADESADTKRANYTAVSTRELCVHTSEGSAVKTWH